MEHEVQSTQVVGPPCYFETAIFEVLRVDDLIFPGVHGLVNLSGVLYNTINTCWVGLE